MPDPVRTLVVTADDFGLSVPVNEAVEEAHRRGILTAASLMVAAPAAEDAIRRARRLPGLGVGLHLTLVAGPPMLPPEAIPDLVTAEGRLSRETLRIGVRIAVRPSARRHAVAEIRAQFEAFRRTGLPLDHVDGHHHFHEHPVVFAEILRLAPEFGVPAVRVPYEPFGISRAAAGGAGTAARLAAALTHARRARRMKRRLRARGIGCNDAIFGLNDSGRLTRERMLAFLNRLPPGAVSELYCHPAMRRWSGPDAPRGDYAPEQEYAALVDPEVIAAASRPGIRRVPFAEAVRMPAGGGLRS